MKSSNLLPVILASTMWFGSNAQVFAGQAESAAKAQNPVVMGQGANTNSTKMLDNNSNNVSQCMVECLKAYEWKKCVWICTGKGPLARPMAK